uniref:Secreted protein n=1 Tax=Fundulus heteroclitus TaxID=8078 RepID=A0A3Q2QP09_FUNHE
MSTVVLILLLAVKLCLRFYVCIYVISGSLPPGGNFVYPFLWCNSHQKNRGVSHCATTLPVCGSGGSKRKHPVGERRGKHA